jgi:hypothetical protein
MNRLIMLDSGPLGMITNLKAKDVPLACQQGLKTLLRQGETVFSRELADYEIHHELLQDSLSRSIYCLNVLNNLLENIIS